MRKGATERIRARYARYETVLPLSLSGQNKWTVFSKGGEFPSIREGDTFLRPFL